MNAVNLSHANIVLLSACIAVIAWALHETGFWTKSTEQPLSCSAETCAHWQCSSNSWRGGSLPP